MTWTNLPWCFGDHCFFWQKRFHLFDSDKLNILDGKGKITNTINQESNTTQPCIIFMRLDKYLTRRPITTLCLTRKPKQRECFIVHVMHTSSPFWRSDESHYVIQEFLCRFQDIPKLAYTFRHFVKTVTTCRSLQSIFPRQFVFIHLHRSQ